MNVHESFDNYKFLYFITEGVIVHSINQHSGLQLIQFKSQFAMNRTIWFDEFTEASSNLEVVL